RWRVAVSPTYWPWAWPAPEPVRLSVFTGGARRLTLPVRAPRPDDAALAPFAPAEGAPPAAVEVRRPSTNAARVSRDVATGRVTLTVESAEGFRVLANGEEYDTTSVDTYTIVAGEPLSAAVRCE